MYPGWGRVPETAVDYTFTEPDGTRRTGTTELPRNRPAPRVGEKLDVRYTPGADGDSRPAGPVPAGVVMVGVFCGILLVGFAAAWGYRAAVARRDAAPRRRARRP